MKEKIIDAIWNLLPTLPNESIVPVPRFLTKSYKNPSSEHASTTTYNVPLTVQPALDPLPPRKNNNNKKIKLEELPTPIKNYIKAMSILLRKPEEEVMRSQPVRNYARIYKIEL